MPPGQENPVNLIKLSVNGGIPCASVSISQRCPKTVGMDPAIKGRNLIKGIFIQLVSAWWPVSPQEWACVGFMDIFKHLGIEVPTKHMWGVFMKCGSEP